MEKWTTIMDLEVQDSLGKDTISSVDMNWSEVMKEDKSIDRVAFVPYSKVPCFIKGEEMNRNAPCNCVRKLYRTNDDIDIRGSNSTKYFVCYIFVV